MMKYDIEVIIVGAGAAGLACASELKKNGVSCLILEARSRPFGRIYTYRNTGAGLPMELGAEFVHGVPRETMDICSRSSISLLDVVDNHHIFENKKLENRKDYFSHLEKILPQSTVVNARDQSIEDWLNAKTVSKNWKRIAQGFVEGFHAADVEIMGRNAFAATVNRESDNLNGSEMFRVNSGYDQVLTIFLRSIAREDLRFQQKVEKLRWQKNLVNVEARSLLTGNLQTFTAKKAVVTIPIGCLKNGDLMFEPAVRAYEKKLSFVEMGHVQKLVLHFKNRFWESLFQEDVPSFVHLASNETFPTWWTQAPLRSNYLVAWQGGPRAETLSKLSETELAQEALVSLAHWTQKKISQLNENLVGIHHHDWLKDPFSRGAYSYVKTFGLSASKALGAPISDTIYFAGEGYCVDSSRGTVHGAIRSGMRAATKILSRVQAKSAGHSLT